MRAKSKRLKAALVSTKVCRKDEQCSHFPSLPRPQIGMATVGEINGGDLDALVGLDDCTSSQMFVWVYCTLQTERYQEAVATSGHCS